LPCQGALLHKSRVGFIS